MSNFRITDLTNYTNPDPANDVLEIVNVGSNSNQKITRNNLLGLTSAPVSINDIQTLTQKTLTAPTISSPILSGTITGTYTLAGTPTFPASVVTLTGSQTLTNKVLTSPTINAPTITNASITADAVTGFSSANTGTIYGLSITAGAISYASLPTGTAVQMVNVVSSAVATGTTVIPHDNTIPQNTEGDQYMSLSITPKSSTNILVIDVIAYVTGSAADHRMMALFQDSTANALAASGTYNATANGENMLIIKHAMSAGTTSATTFKLRAGGTTGTMTFNGENGSQFFAGATKSSIIITEYKA